MMAREHAERTLARCQTLARFSEDCEGTRRTFLSPPMRKCDQEIAEWLRPLGVAARLDAAGNLRGLYPGETGAASRLLIGSHVDTVPNAGPFDGILGVALAVALLEGLESMRLPFAIEVVGFSEEEGVRFGIPFIGSRALVGRLDNELLNREDSNGISVRTALEDFGIDVNEISQARVGEDVLGYLEFHIEQGPVLEDLGLPLGIVDTIAGQSRMEFVFAGHANHAGTTPMHLRRDALAGAAEWIVAVERIAGAQPGLVATVGRITAEPGAPNVIAATAVATLDIRHARDEIRHRAAQRLVGEAEAIASGRGLRVCSETRSDLPATPMD